VKTHRASLEELVNCKFAPHLTAITYPRNDTLVLPTKENSSVACRIRVAARNIPVWELEPGWK